MVFTVNKLSPSDIGYANQLFRFFQIDDGVAEPVIPSDEYIGTLLSKDDFHVIIALQNDRLIGGLTAYELEMYKQEIRELFLYEIAVEPEFRAQGVGRQLIEYLKKIGLAKHIKEMYVGTTSDNTPAMKLYRSTGAEPEAGVMWFVYQLDR